MSAVAQEELYTVIARRDPATGSPLLGDCFLHTGYGSVELKLGQSAPDVPKTVADALKTRGDVMVVASGELGDAPAPIEMPEDTAATKLAVAQRKLEAVEAALLVANGQAGQTEDANTIRIPGPNGEVIVLTQEQLAAIAMQHFSGKSGELTGEGSNPEALEAAREHLREEGEEVPETITPGGSTAKVLEGDGVAKTGVTLPADGQVRTVELAPTVALIPQGFDTNLPDGHPRCWAAKTDKTQCKNPAVDGGHACSLERHQEQLKTAPSEGV